MAFIDLILGCLLAYGLFRGLWNGFIVELASLMSLLIGIWAAIKFSHIIKSVLADHVSWDPNKLQIAAFVLTFILVVVAISLLAKMLTTIIGIAGLGIFNKIMGGLVGVLKMALIISVALNVFSKLNVNGILVSKQDEQQSLFYNPIRKIASAIFPAIASWYSDMAPQNTPTSAP